MTTLETLSVMFVAAYMAYLLLTNQRMTVVTSSTVHISPHASVTDHSVHVGTAFIVVALLVPRCVNVVRTAWRR